MHLPNSDFAEVPLRKITEYLLSAAHAEGWGKAAFFASHGFSRERPKELIDALQAHARACEITLTTKTEHGVKYVLDGPLPTIDGRSPMVRSIWIIEFGTLYPRLVTAYPSPRKSEAP